MLEQPFLYHENPAIVAGFHIGYEKISNKPVYGQQVIIAWLAGQFMAHLCVAGSIRAIPENEISGGWCI